jgi:hypothetical protein
MYAICADGHYNRFFLYLNNRNIITMHYIFGFFKVSDLLFFVFGPRLDESDKKSTSWVQDCLSRGNFRNKTMSLYSSEVHLQVVFLPIFFLLFICRISKDFSLLIIIHSMRVLAIETQMNLVTGKLESQREKYSLLTQRCAFLINISNDRNFSLVLPTPTKCCEN